MNVLVIGSGGREHALAWRMSQDEGTDTVFVYPGNPGMKVSESVIPVGNFDKSIQFETAFKLCGEHQIGLVVIGPEQFLFEGWVDRFEEASIPAFGPTRAASFLEASKFQSKNFMRSAEVPTADFGVARTLDQALALIDSHPHWNGYVLKLSGPAQGKGVVVTGNQDAARKSARELFEHEPQGLEDGMIIEEKLVGPEVSVFYLCDGENYRLLATACDHKRLNDHNEGPNTGGMGAYSPADWLSEKELKTIETRFLQPTLKAMKQNDTPYSGVLFLGILMSADHGPMLLEYNARFGDPETQTFLPRIQGNLTQALHAVASHDSVNFKNMTLSLSKEYSVHVVKSAAGYPGVFGTKIERGKAIQYSPKQLHPRTQVFFAGVDEYPENCTQLMTAGGRVLGITATGLSMSEARATAYLDLQYATFENEHHRTDIGGSS